MNNLDRIRKELSPERRRKITARAKDILDEEMTLREVRKAVDFTQAQVAKILGINQDGVSRLEQRDDLLLSTLREYVKAIGGELRLVVKLPHHKTVVLSEIWGIGAKRKAKTRRPSPLSRPSRQRLVKARERNPSTHRKSENLKDMP